MKFKGLPRYFLSQKIGMLKKGWYVNDRYLLPSYHFVRKWCRTSMYLELELVMVFCASCTAPSLSSNTGMHGIPTSGNIKRQTCLEKSTSLAMSPSATYSASFVESVTHSCVLDNQLTHAPPHIINSPETDVLSAALLTKSASAKACRLNRPSEPLRKAIPNELVRLTYPKIPSAALQCTRLGAAQYLATALTTLEMSGLVWV